LPASRNQLRFLSLLWLAKSEKRKYQKATWGYWKDYQEKLTKDRKGHKENQNVLGTEVSKEDYGIEPVQIHHR
jgi:hypothetical protein